jgi:rhodanese-related sulfurtransferase
MAQFLEFVGSHPILVGAFVALLAAFVLNETRRGGRTVSAQELVNLVNRDRAVVLDVRDRKEFQAGHVTSAINIPFPTLEKRMEELAPHKERTVVVVCRMGQQAGAAGTLLRRAGFQDVARLSGGMLSWRNASLPVVKA